MILNNLILPVVYSSVPLFSLLCVILIFYVHPCVILVVSNFEFAELLSETRFVCFLVLLNTLLGCSLLFMHFTLLSLQEVIHSFLLLMPSLLSL